MENLIPCTLMLTQEEFDYIKDRGSSEYIYKWLKKNMARDKWMELYSFVYQGAAVEALRNSDDPEACLAFLECENAYCENREPKISEAFLTRIGIRKLGVDTSDEIC